MEKFKTFYLKEMPYLLNLDRNNELEQTLDLEIERFIPEKNIKGWIRYLRVIFSGVRPILTKNGVAYFNTKRKRIDAWKHITAPQFEGQINVETYLNALGLELVGEGIRKKEDNKLVFSIKKAVRQPETPDLTETEIEEQIKGRELQTNPTEYGLTPEET